MDASYKLNKAKLMRDVRILRNAARGGLEFTSEDEMGENNFDRVPEEID